MLEVLKEENYQTSEWSGGLTRQIYIWPQGANYQKRDFSFRISSATVDLPESDFTYLEGVNRFLTAITGTMELQFENEEIITVDNQNVLEFDGAKKVHCVGTATDFNLMLKGARGTMYRRKLAETLELHADIEYFIYAEVKRILQMDSGSVVELLPGECCHVKGEDGSLVAPLLQDDVIIVEIYGE